MKKIKNKYMKVALPDTSSLILLYKAGVADLFLEHYCSKISSGVYSELIRESKTGAQDFVRYCQMGQFEVLNTDLLEKTDSGLRGAEEELIRIYRAGVGNFIVIDDKAGARYCMNNRIPFINALLVPRIFYSVSLIDSMMLKEITDKLLEAGRYAPWVIAFSESVAVDKLREFVP